MAVNFLTKPVIHANDVLSLYMTANQTLSSAATILPNNLSVTDQEGIVWDATNRKAIIQAAGRYRISVWVAASTLSAGNLTGISWRLNGTDVVTDRRVYAVTGTSSGTASNSVVISLSAGDELFLRYNANASVTIAGNTLRLTGASIERLSEYYHGSPVGFGLATAERAGLVGPLLEAVGEGFGYIVESGSNSDGRWVKYSDGTMICSKLDPNVGGYGTTGLKSRLWNFPQAFHSSLRPVSLVDNRENNASGTGIRVNHYMRTSDPQTNMTITFNVTTAYLTAPDLMFYAIGRWKA